MHEGIPEYGIEVKVEKSRANYDVVVKGEVIPRLPEVTDFPYCGNAINTITLDLSKDRERRKKSSTPHDAIKTRLPLMCRRYTRLNDSRVLQAARSELLSQDLEVSTALLQSVYLPH